MSFAEPNDGFAPKFKPGPGLPAGMSPLPKVPPPELTRPDAIPRGRGVRSKGDFLRKPAVRLPGGKVSPKPFSPPNAPTGPIQLPTPNFPAIARNIAWEILKPRPTSDGTIPDFELNLPDPDEEPESKVKENICMIECIPNALFFMPKNTGIRLLSVSVVEQGFYTDTSTNTDPGVDFTLRFLGFYTKLSNLVPPDPTAQGFYPHRVEWFAGQESKIENEVKLIRFFYGVQFTGTMRVTGIKWKGKIGHLRSQWVRADEGWTYASVRENSTSRYYWLRRPTFYSELVWCGIPFCDDYEEVEPVEPDDYDREEDDIMACKWKSENDKDVNQLEMREFTFQRLNECYVDEDNQPVARYENETITCPVGLGDSIVKILNTQAIAMGAQCTKYPTNYFWDVKRGEQNTLFAGIPNIAGIEVSVPEGAASVGITFDASEAKLDSSLRDLKRVAAGGDNENTFVHTARCWLIDSLGNAIAHEALWVPSTLLIIPFQFRSQACKVRLMPKSIAVTFTVFDTGDRWKLRKAAIG